MTPYTGREPELAGIVEIWRTTRDSGRGAAGPPPAVLVTGPSGIGKSRLLAEAAAASGAQVVECRCSRYHDTTSLYAFRGLLERVCGIAPRDPVWVRLAKLRARLAAEGERSGDLPFLAAAVGVPPDELSPPPDVDPQKLRETALVATAALVQAVATEPTMLLVDDVHWADRSTLDLLEILLTAPRPGLMLVLAARDDLPPPWPESLVSRMTLTPLEPRALADLVTRVPGGARLTGAQRAELMARSDGVPLFLEELVRTTAAVDAGQVVHRSVRFADYHIPAALRDPLLARLASPEVDLALAQIAATIGRDVDRSLLGQVAGAGGDDLDGRVRSLVSAGLVDTDAAGTLRFRHELIREAAYETQPRSTRSARHSTVADALQARDLPGDTVDAGQLAFHLERAQRYGEALTVHVHAALADQSVGAHAEATRRLTDAVRLVAELPPGEERDRTELQVRELRSFSAVVVGGYAAPEAADDHRCCVELCERAGPEMLPSLVRSWSYYAFRGNLVEADRITDRIDRVVDTDGRAFAEVGRALTAFFQGRFTDSRPQMEAFIRSSWADSAGTPPPGWPLPHDPLVSARSHLMLLLWLAGDGDASHAAGDDALRRATSLEFPYGPFSVGYVTSLRAMIRRLDGDHDGAARLGHELVALGDRHGFRLWGLTGALQADGTAARAGEPAALDRLVQGVAVWRRLLAADVWSPYWLTELAVAQHAAGRREQAAATLDEAAAVEAVTGASFFAAETLRVRGELRLDGGDPAGVADLQRAADLATDQGAPVLAERARAALDRVGVR